MPDENFSPAQDKRVHRLLLELPLKYRWEFTRRHPIYTVCWRVAKAYRAGVYAPDSEEGRWSYLAVMMLASNGITGDPIDPATSFEELDNGETTAPEFLPGPVQPVTHRNLARALIYQLPPAELKCLAAVFQVAASEEYAVDDDTDNHDIQRRKADMELTRLTSPALDAYPHERLYFVDVHASARVLRDTIRRLSRIWKQRLGISERRLPLDKFNDALAVWDRREGWSNGTYSVDRCQSFPEIGRDLGRKKTTLINQYRSAYEWITGRPYSITSWVQLFSRLFIGDSNQSLSNVHLKRFERLIQPAIDQKECSTAASPREVARDSGQIGYLESINPVGDDVESVDFRIDFEELLRKGKSDLEIADILQMSSSSVMHLRSHWEDLK